MAKEPKIIRKLLLIRKADCKSDLLDKAGLSVFIVGDPLNVSPAAWLDEAGISHYGYVLEGMKLDGLDKLNKFVEANHFATALEHEGEVAKTLGSVGLRINELA